MPESSIAPLLSVAESVRDLSDKGGHFVILIFACGVLLWALFLERLAYLQRVLPHETRTVRAAWEERDDPRSWASYHVRRMMISRLKVAMNRGMPLLRVLVPMAPLLGLIGTVSGMLEVFDSMAIHGSADARAMASGVSQAMVCTLTGLAVSISGLYPVYYVRRRIEQALEKIGEELRI